MKFIAGWRIQVSPKSSPLNFSSLHFLDVAVADEADAVDLVRHRKGAARDERVYAVRPLTDAELDKFSLIPTKDL